MKINYLLLNIIMFCLTANILVAQDTSNTVTIIEPTLSTMVTIEIDGMACQEGCADKIASNLNETQGVISAEVSFKDKKGIIVFDPNLVSIEDLKSKITSTKVKDYVYTINSVTIKEKN
ncbi:Copper chaperone CopZ [Maribacter orientalis]|uniref:Copper chaperone CopZ n=1 Tax=Maribacter orientalis TaxID=228957 RepID=A0A1H7KPF2_9FLAO|nr:heavy metal-associated domain-containing protein [Maribacter orientalis]SEK88608.1 Copper chaperone CopZ [Maribacter orientalis]